MLTEKMEDELFQVTYPILLDDLIFADGLADFTVKKGEMLLFDSEDEQYYPMGNIVQGTSV